MGQISVPFKEQETIKQFLSFAALTVARRWLDSSWRSVGSRSAARMAVGWHRRAGQCLGALGGASACESCKEG
jgi:hypothetical protein